MTAIDSPTTTISAAQYFFIHMDNELAANKTFVEHLESIAVLRDLIKTSEAAEAAKKHLASLPTSSKYRSRCESQSKQNHSDLVSALKNECTHIKEHLSSQLFRSLKTIPKELNGDAAAIMDELIFRINRDADSIKQCDTSKTALNNIMDEINNSPIIVSELLNETIVHKIQHAVERVFNAMLTTVEDLDLHVKFIMHSCVKLKLNTELLHILNNSKQNSADAAFIDLADCHLALAASPLFRNIGKITRVYCFHTLPEKVFQQYKLKKPEESKAI